MKRLKPSATSAESALNQPLCVHPMAFAVAVALSSPAAVLAQHNLPTGLQTVNGTVTVTNPTATSMGLNQSSQNARMNADTFSIGTGYRVDITQPNSSSVMLMNVTGSYKSDIFGTLTATGKFFLVNPHGVLFGPGAIVDVGGIVASTLPISYADATAGRYVFTNNGNSGSVINQGRITALNGYVGLFAPKVINEGIIVARMGQVVLAAGNQVTLDMVGDGLIKVTVNEAALNASVMNKGTIEANGGHVLLTARSADALLDTVINTDGVIRANTISNRNGTIVLDGGDRGVVSVSGTIEAKGTDAGTTGGTVKALGQYVGLLDNAVVNVSGDAGGGTALIGGNVQGRGPEQNATVTYMAPSAQIRADAGNVGNGGTVVVWADDTTRALGSGNISARGGAQGGNGGFIETSGKNYLAVGGAANASAPNGNAGLWLLDPSNVTITAATTANFDTLVNTPAAGTTTYSPINTDTAPDTATISAATLSAALSGGTNVVVDTTSAGTAEVGNITVLGAADINMNSGVAATQSLTLQAAGSIFMNSGSQIRATGAGNVLNVTLNTRNNGGVATTTGAVVLDNADIVTQGGSIIIGGGLTPGGGNLATDAAVGTATTKSGVSLTNASVLNAGSGNITITGKGSATATADNNYGVVISGGSQVTGNNVTIKGTGGANGVLNHGVYVTGASSTITSSSGSISVTGVGGAGTNDNWGVLVADTAKIHATGTATISVNGTASKGHGVVVQDSGSEILSAAAGNIDITGAGDGANGNYGVLVNAGGKIRATTSGSANVTVNGSVTASAASNYGVYVFGAGSSISSFNGLASVTGTGANGTSDNVGVTLASGGIVEAANAGNVIVAGTGGNGSTNDNHGVHVVGPTSAISSGSGNVTVTGTGMGGGNADGVRLESGASITTAGSGAISVTGTRAGLLNFGIQTLTGSNVIGGGSHAGAVTLIADSMSLANVAIGSSAGVVTLRQKTDGTLIQLGSGGDGPGALGLTTAELNTVTAPTLHIGNALSGDIDINAAIAPSGATTLSLETGGKIEQGAGATITETNLALRSVLPIVLTEANSVGTLAATVSGAGFGIAFKNAGALSVGSVDSVNGVSTNNGLVNLVATTGGLTVTNTAAAQDVNAGTGQVILEARGVDQLLTVTGNVQGTGGTSLYVADHMVLTGTTTATDMRLRPDSSGVAIELGLHAGETAGKLKLSAAELNTITASNGLAIGSFSGTGITVNAPIAPSGVGKLALLTEGTLTQTAGSTITVGQLLVDATTVNLNEANSVGTLAGEAYGDGIAPYGPFTFRNAGALTIGSVAVAGANFDGILTQDQPLTLIANTGGLTVSNTVALQDVSAGTSTVSLQALGTNQLLTVTGAVQGTGGVTYVADNMALTGLTTATGATATLLQNTSGTLVNLGGADAAGTLGLTSAEINTVTAGILKIGDANSGNLSVSSAIAPSGTSTLSLQTGGTITQSAGITETNLALRSVGAITLNAANSITNLAANISGASNALQFTNAGALSIGSTIDGLAGTTTNGGSQTLIASGGNINVADGSINAGTGAVTLEATLGSILDSSPGADGTAGITTSGAVTLRALGTTGSLGASGATADIDIASSANLTLRAKGDVSVSATTALTNLSLQVDPASQTNSNYSVAAPNISSFGITDSGSDVAAAITSTGMHFTLITDSGKITLANNAISTGVGNVTLLASAGSITDSNLAGPDDPAIDPNITTTGNVTLQAPTGTIGGAGANEDIDINVLATSVVSLSAGFGAFVSSNVSPASLNLTLDPATQDVNYQFTGGTTTVNIGESSGNVDITQISSSLGNFDVNITASTGGIVIGIPGINLTGAGSDVTLTSTLGSITGDASSLVKTTGLLTLSAAAGIGASGSPLKTQVSTVNFGGTPTGIFLNNTGALTVSGPAVVTTGGGIHISANSPLTINTDQTDNAGGDLEFAALGNLATDDLTISANLTTSGGAGKILLWAGSDILHTAGAISSSSNGAINFYAGVNRVVAPGDGAATPAAGAANGVVNQTGGTVSSASGDISIRATGDVTALSVGTTSGKVTLGADASFSDLTLALSDGTGTLILPATAAIASSNGGADAITLRGADININTASATVTATGPGGVRLFTSQGTQTMEIGGAGAANFNLSDTELLRLTTYNALTIGESAVQSGNITFVTATMPVATGTLTVNANSGAGGIVLNDAGAAAAIGNGSGAVNLTAGSGGITATNAANGFAEISTSGAVTLNTGGTVGTVANPIEFAGMPSSVVVGNVTPSTAGEVALRGLATGFTTGAITTTNRPVTITSQGTTPTDSITIAGPISTGTGAISIQSPGAVAINNTITTTGVGGTITINANTTGADADSFTQGAFLISSGDTGANAVRITVNEVAGSTGTAQLDNITVAAGGSITVRTNGSGGLATTGGSITQTDTKSLTATTGTVTLTTGAAGASGIGAAGAANDINTTAATVIATAGSGGVFITESNGASFTATAQGAGAITLTNSAGLLTIAGASGTGTGAVTLLSAGGIAVNSTITTTGGNVSATAGGTLDVNQAITTTPTAGVSAATRKGGSVFLQADDAITTTAAITTTGQATAANATAETAGDGGEVVIFHTNVSADKAITLGAAINASGGASGELGDTAGAGATVTIRNQSGNIVTHNITADGGAPGGGTAGTGGAIQLQTQLAAATISQAGGTALMARGGTVGTNDGSLKVDATGAVTLANAANNVGTLAGSVSDSGAAFSYTDATSIDVGSIGAAGTAPGNVGAKAGITTNTGNITVTALGTGNVTLSSNASTGGTTGTVTLDASAGGAVTETTGAVIADKLRVLAVNTSLLDTTTNNVNTLAGNISGAGANFSYTDAGSVDVGTVTTVGLTTNTGNIGVKALGTGNVTLSSNASTGGTTGTVTLDASAGGAVTETTGAVIADKLLVLAANSSELIAAANNVLSVAATITGAGQTFSYRDSNAVNVDTVGATNGITTNAANIVVTTASGNLGVNQAITTGSGSNAFGVGLQAAGALGLAANVTSGRVIVVSGTGTTQTAGAVSTSAFRVGGAYTLTNVSSPTGTITLAGNIGSFTTTDNVSVGTVAAITAGTQTVTGQSGVTGAGGGGGGGTPGGSGGGGSGDVSITGGSVVVANDITAAGFTVTLQATTGAVNETTGAVIADKLRVLAVTNSALDTTTNNVNTLAANISGANQNFSYTDAGSVDVGTVTTVGVTTNAGNIGVTALGTGNVTLSSNASTGGTTGTVTLTALGGAVTETTGAVIADQLRVRAANSSLLDTATNNVNTLAANISGASQNFSYTDATSVDVGTVTTVGVTTNAGNIGVKALGTGNVTLSSNASTGGTTGTVTLDASAGGAVTETTGAVIADKLRVLAVNTSLLDTTTNNVNTLAGNISGAGANFSYTDAGSVDVGTVTTVGLTTNTGNIGVKALGTGNVTLSSNASTGGTTGTVTLDASAGGAVTETTGAVIADKLLVLAANSSELIAATNNVLSVAATITGAGQTFSYRDSNAVNVDTVGATNGITTNGANIVVKTGSGNLGVNQPITTGANNNAFGVGLQAAGALNLGANITSGRVLLVSGTGTTQTVGSINTSALGVDGAFTIGTVASPAGLTLASQNTSSVTFSTTDDLTVGSVASVTAGTQTVTGFGGVTSSGDISLTGNSITLVGDVVAGAANTVTLTATTLGVNETTGKVTGGNLRVLAVTNSALDTTTNNVNTLAANISGANQNFSYTDAGSVDVGTVTTVGVTTNAGNIGVTALGTGNVTLSSNASTGGTTGTVTLTALGGAVTETTGAVIADQLRVRAANSSLLDTATNNVNTLAANISGASQNFSYTDATSVDVGTVTTVGVTTNAGNIGVKALGTGNVTLSSNASTGGTTGTVTLDASAGGAVTETTGAVIADKLRVLAVNTSLLDTATNNVNTLAANISGANQNFSYTDAGSVDVGTVTTVGVTTNAGNIGVTALGTGNVTLSSNASTGGTTGTVTLTALGGAVTETTGAVIADQLRVRAANSSLLDTATNNVNTLAANISGANQNFSYTDAGSVDVGTVTTVGVTTNAGNIGVKALGTGNVTLSSNASTGGTTGTVTLDASAGGAVTETTGAVIADKLRVLAANTSLLDTATNNVNTLAANISGANQNFSYTDAGSVDVGTVTTVGVTTNAGNIGVTALGTGNVTLSSNASTGGTTGTVTLTALGGAVTETTGAVIADQLRVRAANSSLLDTATNNVNTLAANISGASQNFSYTDATSVDVGTVTTVGVTTNAGNIGVKALGTGNVTLSSNASTGGTTGTVTLDASAGGAVTETTGAVIADKLRVLAVNSSSLNTATNNVNTLAANISGASQTFSYIDATGVEVGTVTTVGVTTNAGKIGVKTITGDLSVNQPINAGAAATVTLQAVAGNVVGSSPGVITAGTLGVSGLAIDLGSSMTNQVTSGGTVAMRASGGNLIFRNANGYNINTVAADAPVFTATVDGLFANNDMTLRTDADTVTQTPGKNVTAVGLELRGAGSYTLTNLANNVTTIAGSTTGTVKYVDADALTVGTVNSTAGFTGAAGNTVKLNTRTADLTVNQPINTGAAGTVTLESMLGNVTQTGGVITADTLGVKAALGIDLTGASNAVSGTVAMNAAGGSLKFLNTSGYEIGTVPADLTSPAVVFSGASGLSATTFVSLNTTAGTVTQGTATTEAITAPGLKLLGAGAYELNNASNNVATLAASTTNAISYTDADDLLIGTVDGTANLTSTTGGVTLVAGGDLTPTSVNSGTGAISLTANDILAGTVTGGSTLRLESNLDVVGLVINIPAVGTPITVIGGSGPWHLDAGNTALGDPKFWSVNPPSNGPELVVKFNTVDVGFIDGAATSAAAAAQASVAQAAASAADLFGTDSVEQQIEYGFAGDVGTLPPIDHRLQGVGISVPNCFNESREGESCAGQQR